MIRFLYVRRATTIQLPKRFELTGKLTSMVRKFDWHATSGGHGRRVLWEASKPVSFREACSCVLFCLRPTVFLGTNRCIYLLNVLCILGVERRKNSPSSKENEVAMGESNKVVSADFITILVSQTIQRFWPVTLVEGKETKTWEIKQCIVRETENHKKLKMI